MTEQRIRNPAIAFPLQKGRRRALLTLASWLGLELVDVRQGGISRQSFAPGA